MKKIISLFQRNYDGDHLVRDEVVPGAEWVLAGEGVATRKWDGTCCLVKDGRLWKRYDAKHGKTPPPDFVPAQDADPVTGHWPGWVPVAADGKQDEPYRAAFRGERDGTYELCGPKVNANPENFATHLLVPHGNVRYPACPRDFDGIREWLAGRDIEGVVFHHPDGRMVKIKAGDFGLKRQVAAEV